MVARGLLLHCKIIIWQALFFIFKSSLPNRVWSVLQPPLPRWRQRQGGLVGQWAGSLPTRGQQLKWDFSSAVSSCLEELAPDELPRLDRLGSGQGPSGPDTSQRYLMQIPDLWIAERTLNFPGATEFCSWRAGTTASIPSPTRWRPSARYLCLVTTFLWCARLCCLINMYFLITQSIVIWFTSSKIPYLKSLCKAVRIPDDHLVKMKGITVKMKGSWQHLFRNRWAGSI